MDVADPIADSERRLAQMLDGRSSEASAEATRAGIAAARADQGGGGTARSVGLGLIRTLELYDGGDWREFLIAITDGTRDGVITARLSGSAVATLRASGEDAAQHLLNRMRSAVGTLPNDGHRYVNVILNHPATYSA